VPKTAFTVKVGARPRSLARYHLDAPQQVREVLRQLADTSAASPAGTDDEAAQPDRGSKAAVQS
jgi:hypothetical protein